MAIEYKHSIFEKELQSMENKVKDLRQEIQKLTDQADRLDLYIERMRQQQGEINATPTVFT